MTIEVRNLDFYYGNTKALEGISFSVDEGDFLGIIGPNGSGKTTLLKCISGALKPKPRSVLLGGRDVSALRDREMAKVVSMVPQIASLDTTFSALEVVLMGRNPHLGRLQMEGEKDLRIAREAMELTNTWAFASRPVNRLSGGELQRVIISQALVQEPNILLLDEPTAHLDLNHQIEILNLIERLNGDRHMTVIGVFHDLNLAARYCRRLLLLDHGRLVSVGGAEQVITQENLRRVYHISALVKKHPLTASLYVIPLSREVDSVSRSGKTVHLICGGGSGAQIMEALMREGCNVTAGVLNVLDSDYEVAKSLGITAVEEAPFSQITDEAYERNLSLIGKADVVIVADAAFGFGNLRNLDSALWAAEHGKRLILLETTPFEARDFTKGRAKALYDQLRKSGEIAGNFESALAALRCKKE